MKLTIYVLQNFILSLIQVSFFIMALVFLVDVIDQYSRFASKDVEASRIFLYCILRILENYLQFLPLIVLLSTLLCFLNLSRHSEIVVMRAAGVPATKFVFTPLFAALVLGALIVTLLNPIVVSSRLMTQKYESQFLGRSDGIVSARNGNGVWLRSESNGEVRLIRFDKLNRQDNKLKGVTFYRLFGNIENAQYSEQIDSPSGQIKDNEWVLNNALVSQFKDRIETQIHKAYSVPMEEDLKSLFYEYSTPKSVRNFDLPDYINGLKNDGYDTKEAESYMLSQLAYPFLLMTLALIGSIFALAPARFGGTTRRLFFALGFGFLVYGAVQLANSVGVAGYIPLWLAAFGVSFAAFSIALAILLSEEDG